MPETERARPQDIAARPLIGRAWRSLEARRRRFARRHGSHQLIEGFGCAPVFLFLIGGQLERHDRDGQPQRSSQASRIILNQLRRARCADQQGLRLETLIGIRSRPLEQVRGVRAQIPGLKRGVGDRRPARQAFDHGEQQIRIGVPLRRVQHVMHIPHGGRDAHGADVRRSFICPQGELHGSGHQTCAANQGTGEQPGEVRRLLEELNRREYQFDRPLRRQAPSLEWIRQSQTADHEVRLRRQTAVQLIFDVLTFHHGGAGGQVFDFSRKMRPVQERGADLAQFHAHFVRQEASQRYFQLRIGKEEYFLARELVPVAGQAAQRALIGRLGRAAEPRFVDVIGRGRRLQPARACLARRAGRAPEYGARPAPRARARYRRGTAAPAGTAY